MGYCQMNQIAQTPDYWTPATREEVLKCLSFLSGLPSRDSANGQMETAGYYVALEGVSRFAIQTASKAIMRGALGHTFFPSPPELRIQCEDVMKPIREAHARDKRDREVRADMKRDSERQYVPPERRRALVQKWETMKAEQDAQRQNEEFETVSELRSRIIGQIGETAFNNIPDLPVRDTFKQVGTAR